GRDPAVSCWSFFSGESEHVNEFPQRGGNCAQVVCRGRRGPDAGTSGESCGAHPEWEREPALYTVYRHRRSCGRDQCGQGEDHWNESGTEDLSPLYREPWGLALRGLYQAPCSPA